MQSKLHTHYKLTIEVLTPLHVGNGHELLRNYDYVVRGGRTWVIDQERLLEATLGEDGEFDNMLLTRPPAELLRPDDFYEDSPFFRYVMPGEPANRPLREQIKDVWGNPYLPGSTVKGALRTLLLWGIYTAEKRQPELAKLGPGREQAAQELERSIFGPDPNRDLLRALHVADSSPVSAGALRVERASVFPTGGEGAGRSRGQRPDKRASGVIVDVEALSRGTVFVHEVAIEEYGFSNPKAAQELGWDAGQRHRFDFIPRIGQYHAAQRLRDEQRFYEQKASQASDFFTWLEKQRVAENEWFMQIGWGTSWHSKTLNNLLTDQRGFEQKVVQKYRLARGRRKEGDPFPKSRNLVLRNGQPARPMGWVKCRLEPL